MFIEVSWAEQMLLIFTKVVPTSIQTIWIFYTIVRLPVAFSTIKFLFEIAEVKNAVCQWPELLSFQEVFKKISLGYWPNGNWFSYFYFLNGTFPFEVLEVSLSSNHRLFHLEREQIFSVILGKLQATIPFCDFVSVLVSVNISLFVWVKSMLVRWLSSHIHFHAFLHAAEWFCTQMKLDWKNRPEACLMSLKC